MIEIITAALIAFSPAQPTDGIGYVQYRCYATGGVYVGTFSAPQEGFLCILT